MSDNKKYYYLRLKENFFESEEIKVLESMSSGYKYSNILLKLYLKSLKYDGALRLNEYIPYNPEMIAAITGHEIDTVKGALEKFRALKLIEVMENGTIYMLDIQRFIGKTTTEADRIRLYRKKIEDEKMLPESKGVQMYDKSTPEIELEKEIELDIEKDIDIKKDIEKKGKKNDFSQDSNEFRLSQYLFNFIKRNNSKAKEPNLQNWAKTFDYILRIDERDIEDVKAVIKWCQNDSFWYKNILSPSKLREKFDTLYLQMKEPIKSQRKGHKGTNFADYDQREFDNSIEDKLLGLSDERAEESKENIQNVDDEYSALQDKILGR